MTGVQTCALPIYNYEFDQLSEIQQNHLIKIWLLASKLNNRIPNDQKWIGRQIGAKSKIDIKQLCTSGFLRVYENVQECTETYSRAGSRSLETETETYREETEKKELRASKNWKKLDRKSVV